MESNFDQYNIKSDQRDLSIYFAGSIRGGRQDAELYYKIIKWLQENYGEVLTEHVGSKNLTKTGENNTLTDKEIHDRDMAWLESADIIIAEVTQASLGVGYEIGRALEKGIKVICLFRQKEDGKSRLSAMISGCEEIVNIKYNDLKSLQTMLKGFFKSWKQDQLTLEFNLSCYHYRPDKGKALYLVGNLPELGSWKPRRALRMKQVGRHEFRLSIPAKLRQVDSIEYKYILQPDDLEGLINLKNYTKWEQCYNRGIPRPTPGKTILSCIKVNDTWGKNLSNN